MARANRSLANRARFGLGGDSQDSTSGVETDLDADAIVPVAEDDVAGLAAGATHAALRESIAAHGLPKISVVAGEDETATHQITVTGMAAGDIVVAVLVFTTAASIATMAAHAGTLTAASGKITPGTEVVNTGNQYVVFWIDVA